MNILEDIYYNNINPAKFTAEDSRILDLICKNENKLAETLTEAQKEIFKKYRDCEDEMDEKSNRDIFVQGFIMGARIIIEVMYKNPAFDREDMIP